MPFPSKQAFVDNLQTVFSQILRERENGIDVNFFVSSHTYFLVVQRLFTEFEFLTLLDLWGVDNLERASIPKNPEQSEARFQISTILLNYKFDVRLKITFLINQEQKVPSLTKIYNNAVWPEREVREFFGLNFLDCVYENLILHPATDGFPLRKDFIPVTVPLEMLLPVRNFFSSASVEFAHKGNFVEWLELGPFFAEDRGAIRILAKVDGEQVYDVNMDVGLSHRAVEKICEVTSYSQIPLYMERLNYHSSALNSLCWVKGLEDFMHISISERSMAMRMVFAELSRIFDHLGCLMRMVIGSQNPFADRLFLLQREKIKVLFSEYSGQRLFTRAIVPGGLSTEMPGGWITSCMETMIELKKFMARLNKSFVRNLAWIESTDYGPISANDAICEGITGPNLRASGINYDLRKRNPYYFYSELEFDIPIGQNGTMYDRFLVRLEEINQSIRIITQILDNLPLGSVLAEQDMTSLFESGEIWQQCHPGEFYSNIEGSNGELAICAVIDSGPNPYRLHVRSPSLYHAQFFSCLVKGTKSQIGQQALPVASLLQCFDSLNIIASEIDR